MKKILLFLFLLPVIFSNAQNAIVGPGFSSGWGGGCPTPGNSNFNFLSSNAGSSYILTTTPTGGTSGDKYWRYGIDWSGTIQQWTITSGVDVTVSPNTTYTLTRSCNSSGSLKYNVSNGSWNYVFKTKDVGTNPTGDVVFFEVQGTVRTISSLAQSPLVANVFPGQGVLVTATMSGVQSTGQNVYIRYTTDNFATSTVATMTYSGSSATYTIPASVNTPSASIKYYVFTSGTANVATNGSNADFYTINLNNNGGSNFSYIVASGWTTTSNANWSSAATWTASAVPPTSNSMGNVTIANDVTLDQDATVSSLTINTSKTFTASDVNPRTLTISKSASGTSTTLLNSGTWQNGTGTSTVIFSGAPSSGDAIHQVSGTIGFQNVTVQKTGGSNNVGVSFVGTGSSVSGTFKVGSGGYVSTAPPTNFYGNNAILKFDQGSGATYDVGASDNSWSTSQVPNNITISSGTVNLNSSRTAPGNLLIDGGALVLNTGSPTLTIQGNWTRTSGSFSSGTGTVAFTGTTNTNVSTATAANVYNLTINKTSGAIVTLASDLAVANILTFTSGKLSIGSNTLSLAGTVSGMSASNSLTGSSSSNLSVTGTGALGTLYFDQTTDGTTNILNNITVNRTSTGTLSLGNKLVLLDGIIHVFTPYCHLYHDWVRCRICEG